MDTNLIQLRHRLNAVVKYLTPYLPLANCHMVEFITEKHWERFIPQRLRKQLDECNLEDSLNKFWNSSIHSSLNKDSNIEECELSTFINAARSHCLRVDKELCLSVEQLSSKIKSWGGVIRDQIRVTEFMSLKKSYEVQMMSPLVCSLREACRATHCVDLGGGRGHLPIVLDLGYSVPSLAVDCDAVALEGGKRRDKMIQKKWPSIARGNAIHVNTGKDWGKLHRFANSFVTQKTDLCDLVKVNFPEHCNDDVKLLLTGLHTCGNLGPDSLRIFNSDPRIVGILNVPCCYHLLSEVTDGEIYWNVFEKSTAREITQDGFPMSQHLTGYQLGRNARMLAAQSIDRVVSLRQLPSRSLHYRAVLQVIIKKFLPHTAVPEGKLKRTTQKCHNFAEYFKMADGILKLGLHDSLAADRVTEIYNDMESEWKRLVLFYMLRMCLAQVIEAVILIDRLLFLRENGYDNAFLVKIFDATLSPRCHGIVAKR